MASNRQNCPHDQHLILSLPQHFIHWRRIAGVLVEVETRELIVQENRRYAKRQLIWFRKEPNLRWINRAGEHPDALKEVVSVLQAQLL